MHEIRYVKKIEKYHNRADDVETVETQKRTLIEVHSSKSMKTKKNRKKADEGELICNFLLIPTCLVR